MKKFLIFLLTGPLVLGACNNDNSSDKESNNKSDNKTEEKTNNDSQKNNSENETSANNNTSSNNTNQKDNVESNEQTANTNDQDNETNTSTDNSANDIGEAAAIEQAKDFPGGDVIDVQNIDWNSFHIDKDRTNQDEYHVKYYYNGISTPMPFEVIINRETGEKIGANNLANKQQMEEYKSMLKKNEEERQQRLSLIHI